MFKINRITSLLLHNSLLKIEYKFGKNTEIPIETINKVYLNVIKPAFYIWVSCFIVTAFVTAIVFVLINILVAFFVFVSLLFFTDKMLQKSKPYNLWVEFKDKNTYSVIIPNKMKEEVKNIIWDIRSVIIRNK